jgi:hypothetical protein
MANHTDSVFTMVTSISTLASTAMEFSTVRVCIKATNTSTLEDIRTGNSTVLASRWEEVITTRENGITENAKVWLCIRI